MTYRQITEDDVEKLRLLLRSSAWHDVVRPAWLARREMLVSLMLQNPSERGDKSMSDDVIRGIIKQLDWDLTRFDQSVDEFDHNKRVDELHAQHAGSP